MPVAMGENDGSVHMHGIITKWFMIDQFASILSGMERRH
jgi:hypothetical protein